MNRELKAIKKLAEQQGWSVEPTRSGHLTWRNPEGILVTRTATTCAGSRTIKNYIAYLKRGGLQLQGRK